MASKHLFHQHIDIVLSTNGVNILANVVITNPIWVNIVLKAIISKGVVAMITKFTMINTQGIPFVVEVFSYLH